VRPRDQAADDRRVTGTGPRGGTRTVSQRDRDARAAAPALSGSGQARLAASRLTVAGKPVSRRTLRSEGIRGSNQALNALARIVKAELAGAAAAPAMPGNAVA
jgi:hypothetical protein